MYLNLIKTSYTETFKTRKFVPNKNLADVKENFGCGGHGTVHNHNQCTEEQKYSAGKAQTGCRFGSRPDAMGLFVPVLQQIRQ